METLETVHEDLANVLDNSAQYSTMSNVLANGVIFSTLKHTDQHTIRGRSPLKVGKLVSVRFEMGHSTNSIANESNDLARCYQNQTRNHMKEARVNALTAYCLNFKITPKFANFLIVSIKMSLNYF